MIVMKNYIDNLRDTLHKTIITDSRGVHMETNIGLEQFVDLSLSVKQNKSNVFFVGNGASASMSSHMSADAEKNGGFKTHVFYDLSLITAISNDISYAEIFALPLKRNAAKDDLLITISSSGNSSNIIRALETAKELSMKTVTLSGMKPENRSRSMGDLNIFVPSFSYGMVECAHQAILHCWLDRVMEKEGIELCV